MFRNIYIMVITDLEYRQRKLDNLITKYNNGYYDGYYFQGDDYLIVFVKQLKSRTKKNCFNISGLNFRNIL